MHTRILAVGLTALGLFLAQNVRAGEDTSTKREHSVRRASQINGKYVKNGEGEDAQTLGHVADMVMNLKDGSIVYVALGHGQTLGFGGKMFAIAPDAFKVSSNGEYLILNGVTEQQLENAKGFDANTWPQQPDRQWSKGEARGQGGVREAVKEAGEAVKQAGQDVKQAVQGTDKDNRTLTRVSAIMGMAVRTPEDKSLGHIYDLAVDCDNHKVAYAAVNYGSTLGIGGKLVAVPWTHMQVKSLTLRPGANMFVVNTTQEQFESAPTFNNDSWPARPQEQFWSKIERTGNRGSNQNDRD